LVVKPLKQREKIIKQNKERESDATLESILIYESAEIASVASEKRQGKKMKTYRTYRWKSMLSPFLFAPLCWETDY